ncbi:MAG: hypothetical protein GF401_09175 [Chitinivibrionales bacterium]|nr:hypothetical protein [Chitinivibrionales bacterium]
MLKEEREAVKESYAGIEDGDVFFFYRPKTDNPESAHDIQSLQLVLHPLASRKFRLLILDTAVMPQRTETFNEITGRVDCVTDKEMVIRNRLKERFGETRGIATLEKPYSRICAEGVYSLVPHNNRMYLVYLLELPALPGNAQQVLGIRREDEFLVGVYNPLFGKSEEDLEREEVGAEEPRYPDQLQKTFNRGHITYDVHPELLDYENARFGLFRRGSKEARTHAADVGPMWEDFDTADIFRKLEMRKERIPIVSILEDLR